MLKFAQVAISYYVLRNSVKFRDVLDFIHNLLTLDVEVVIPPRPNRTEQRDYDRHWYKEQHLVKCFVTKERGLNNLRNCCGRSPDRATFDEQVI